MNTSPPAVTIGPPELLLAPVSCLPLGNSSVMPRRLAHRMSPVLALTAISRPHGGLMQGRVTFRPSAAVKLALNPE